MPAGERPIVTASQGPEPEPELSSTRGLRRTDMMLLVVRDCGEKADRQRPETRGRGAINWGENGTYIDYCIQQLVRRASIPRACWEIANCGDWGDLTSHNDQRSEREQNVRHEHSLVAELDKEQYIYIYRAIEL